MRLHTFSIAASTSLVLATTVLAGSPATAGRHPQPPSPAPTPGPTISTVATGLDNPRLLSFDGKALYVAESGKGGSGPCLAGPEGGEVCFGTTGAVTRIIEQKSRKRSRHDHGRGHHTVSQTRVLTGLPSLAGPDGSQASGPSDVAVAGGSYLLSVGLGGTPETRTSVGPGAATMGTLLTGTLSSKASHGSGPRKHRDKHAQKPRVLADLAAFEAANDPDGQGSDSNPVGFALSRHGVAAVDAGGNDLLKVSPKGQIQVLATFARTMVPAPPFMPPGEVPMDAVPTSVAQGPDGAWYVSQLTGFPFPAGGSSVFRVVPGQAPTVYASGLTTVTDLAWHRGSLYVVQLTEQGLLAVPENTLPTGSLRRINRDGSSTVIADGLTAPYGVALRGSSAYVSTCSVCAAGGEVVKIGLR